MLVRSAILCLSAVWVLFGGFASAADTLRMMAPEKKAIERPPAGVGFLKLPDLIVESMTFTPANPKAGDTATLTIVIKNIGAADSGAADGEAKNLPKNFSEYIYLQIPPLAPGASRAFSYSAPLSDKSPGKYTLGFDMNRSYKKFQEVTFDNNYKNLEITIAPTTTQLPDLAFDRYHVFDPQDPVNHAPATFSFRVKNIGASPSTPTTVSIYSDPKVMTAFGLPASVNVPALAAGQASALYSFTPPGGILAITPSPPNYPLYLNIDPNRTLKELTVQNNVINYWFSVQPSPTLRHPKPVQRIIDPRPLPPVDGPGDPQASTKSPPPIGLGTTVAPGTKIRTPGQAGK